METEKVFIEDYRLDYGYAWAEVIRNPIKCRNYARETDYVFRYRKGKVYQDPYNFNYYLLIPDSE